MMNTPQFQCPLKAFEECCFAQIFMMYYVIMEQLLLCKSNCWVLYDQTPPPLRLRNCFTARFAALRVASILLTDFVLCHYNHGNISDQIIVIPGTNTLIKSIKKYELVQLRTKCQGHLNSRVPPGNLVPDQTSTYCQKEGKSPSISQLIPVTTNHKMLMFLSVRVRCFPAEYRHLHGPVQMDDPMAHTTFVYHVNLSIRYCRNNRKSNQ